MIANHLSLLSPSVRAQPKVSSGQNKLLYNSYVGNYNSKVGRNSMVKVSDTNLKHLKQMGMRCFSMPLNQKQQPRSLPFMKKVVSSNEYNEMQVIFKLNHAETVNGQNALISGSVNNLGLWDPARARVMTSEGTYPHWKNDGPVSISRDEAQNIEYKYFITDGEEILWEHGQNRSVDLSGFFGFNSPIVVEDYWFNEVECKAKIYTDGSMSEWQNSSCNLNSNP